MAEPSHGAPLDEVRQRRAELREAMTGLEVAIAAPFPGRADEWVAEVSERFAELQRDFADHLEITEEPGGLHDDLVETAPRLASGVAHLVKEHKLISAAIDAAQSRLESARTDAEEIPGLRDAVLEVLSLLARHRQRGSDLVWEAYTYDVGGET